MISINRSATNHDFQKQNLVTILDKSGHYDLYKCSNCGLTGKGRDLINILVGSQYKKKAFNCPGAKAVKKIKIIKCFAVGSAFENLIPDSVHNVIDPPSGKDNSRGVWVMGVGEPVKVLFEEYEEIP